MERLDPKPLTNPKYGSELDCSGERQRAEDRRLVGARRYHERSIVIRDCYYSMAGRYQHHGDYDRKRVNAGWAMPHGGVGVNSVIFAVPSMKIKRLPVLFAFILSRSPETFPRSN